MKPDPTTITRPAEITQKIETDVSVPLEKLAWGRSGDKGDKANIGVVARNAEYIPYIWAALTPEAIAKTFVHLIDGGSAGTPFSDGPHEQTLAPTHIATDKDTVNVGRPAVVPVDISSIGELYAELIEHR